MDTKAKQAQDFQDYVKQASLPGSWDVEALIACCLNNASDAPEGQVFETARATMELYLDGACCPIEAGIENADIDEQSALENDGLTSDQMARAERELLANIRRASEIADL